MKKISPKKNLNKSGSKQTFERLTGIGGLIPRSRVRVWPFTVLVVAVAIVLVGRLGQLSLVEGSYLRTQAENNRILGVRSTAPRGVFFDTNGVALVQNMPVYKRQVPGTTVAQGMFEEIGREEAVKLQYQTGERVFFDIKRDYACGRACAMLLGYMSEITEEELAVNTGDYLFGDMVGKAGLEKMYEKQLRGQPGSELVEVNAQGELERTLGKIEQMPGTDLHLTIDSELQKVLYAAFEDNRGAAVAQVPQTGEILALVSVPAFDPHFIASSLEEDNEPFFNRAIGGAYPPGSVFKIVTAVAGLEEAAIDAETTFEDTGELIIDEYRYGNWYFDEYGRTEGAVDLVKGLQRSNDIFFYKVGGAVGAEAIADWARLMGYDAQSGLEALGEVAGLIPDPQWKSRYKGEKWFLGNTYHMAIGQGDVLVTPLQVNRAMTATATGGTLCPPILLKYDVGKKGCAQLNLHTESVDLVHEGLQKACESGGTGVPFFKAPYKVGCKTGTAQQGGEKADPHAWFTVYAPADNPEIALTVMVERGGQGSEVAAPIAKVGIDYWMGRTK